MAIFILQTDKETTLQIRNDFTEQKAFYHYRPDQNIKYLE